MAPCGPSLQLFSLGPNALIAEMWEPIWILECSNLPQETGGQEDASLSLGQNCKRSNLWFGLHASCGPTRSCLTNLASQLGAFAGREGVSTSGSRRSWCECSNLIQLDVLELTQMNFAESWRSCFLMGNAALLQVELGRKLYSTQYVWSYSHT